MDILSLQAVSDFAKVEVDSCGNALYVKNPEICIGIILYTVMATGKHVKPVIV